MMLFSFLEKNAVYKEAKIIEYVKKKPTFQEKWQTLLTNS